MSAQNIAEDYEKIKEIFSDALELAPEARAAFFAQIDEDKRLIAEVKSLLAAREEAGEFLNNGSIKNSIRHGEKYIGQTIDHYRVEREIGRGGMGVVFLATREDFRQQVALKIIKRGMDSDLLISRFRREREILATLNHPFIARLLDGGTTKDDLPYFILELVEGVPIDEYCKTNNLSETQKLELFRKVCEALIFAHQKLIIHRDLKPSNILVTADGTPKLLDFGIAKLLDSTEAETQTYQRVLTPAYASPEQLRGEEVDTRSDVYSLGKILAKLLLGEDSKNLRLSTVKNKVTVAQKHKLNTDLRNILAMSLREETARRYGSVEKFSEDIRYYLAGLPVAARRDTFAYRTAKFLGRNRIATAAFTLFIITLTIGIAATLWQAREAQREREVAERRLENLRKMSDSFSTEIYGAVEHLPGSLPARRMLARYAVEQLDSLAAESKSNLELRDGLAQAYLNLGDLPDMLLVEKDATLRKAIEIYSQLNAEAPDNVHFREQTGISYAALANIAKVRGSLANSLDYYKKSIEIFELVDQKEPDSIAHLSNLSHALLDAGKIYLLQGRIEDSSQMSVRALSVIEKLRKINENERELLPLIVQAKIQISVEQMHAGDYKPAIETLSEILGQYEEELTRNGNDTSINYYLWTINRRLADVLERSGDFQGALKHYETAYLIIEKLLASSPKDFGYHRNSALSHILYGEMLMRRKQYAEALESFPPRSRVKRICSGRRPGTQRIENRFGAGNRRHRKYFGFRRQKKERNRISTKSCCFVRRTLRKRRREF